MMFLSPPWCFCLHSANFVRHAQRTKCFPECICMFQNFNRCTSTQVGQWITIFNIWCILAKIEWTPFRDFFIIFYCFRGSAKFKTDLKSEYRNNIFQFETHYFSLNKTNFVSLWLILYFLWIFKYIYWPHFVWFDSKTYTSWCQTHKMRSVNIFKIP